MSKTRLRQWQRLMIEIEGLYKIEHTMSVSELLEKLNPLRESQDRLRDK